MVGLYGERPERRGGEPFVFVDKTISENELISKFIKGQNFRLVKNFEIICLQKITKNRKWPLKGWKAVREEDRMLVSNIFHFTMFSKSFFLSFINPLLHRYSFRHVNNRQLLKTLWENEKLLITSIFSCSHK